MIGIKGDQPAFVTSPHLCEARNLDADDGVAISVTVREDLEAFLVEPAHVIVPAFG